MNHTDGWMNGWVGEGMWIWTVIGVVIVALLVVIVINQYKKKWFSTQFCHEMNC